MLLQTLLLSNGLFALAAAGAWNAIAPVVGDPLRWATSRAMAAQPGLLDYPFNLLWLLPVAGAAIAWIAARAGRAGMARWFAAAPMLFIGLIVVWYYFAPPDWR